MHDLVRPVGELEQSKVSRAAVAGFGPSKRSSKRSSVRKRKGRGVEFACEDPDVKRLTITDNTRPPARNLLMLGWARRPLVSRQRGERMRICGE